MAGRILGKAPTRLWGDSGLFICWPHTDGWMFTAVKQNLSFLGFETALSSEFQQKNEQSEGREQVLGEWQLRGPWGRVSLGLSFRPRLCCGSAPVLTSGPQHLHPGSGGSGGRREQSAGPGGPPQHRVSLVFSGHQESGLRRGSEQRLLCGDPSESRRDGGPCRGHVEALAWMSGTPRNLASGPRSVATFVPFTVVRAAGGPVAGLTAGFTAATRFSSSLTCCSEDGAPVPSYYGWKDRQASRSPPCGSASVLRALLLENKVRAPNLFMKKPLRVALVTRECSKHASVLCVTSKSHGLLTRRDFHPPAPIFS